MKSRFFLLILLLLILTDCSNKAGKPILKNEELTLRFNDFLHTKIDYDGAEKALIDNYQPSESIRLNGKTISNFQLREFYYESIDDDIGKGERLVLIGDSDHPEYKIRKKVIATAYNKLSNLITIKAEYLNNGNKTISLDGWSNNRYTVKSLNENANKKRFWSLVQVFFCKSC